MWPIFPQVNYLGKIFSIEPWICQENNRISLDSYPTCFEGLNWNPKVVSQYMLVGKRADDRFHLIASRFTWKTSKCKSFVAFAPYVSVCQRKKITGATAVKIKSGNVSHVTRKFFPPHHMFKAVIWVWAGFETSSEALEEPTRYPEADVPAKQKR